MNQFKFSFIPVILFQVVFLNFSFSQDNALTSFANATTFASVANAAALNPTNITVEAWIYPTAWRTNEWEGSIVNKEGAGGYMLRCGNNGQLSFYVHSGGNWRGGSTATNALSLNTWTHVAGVYNGTNVLIFINGAQVASFAYTGTITSTTEPVEIGRSNLNTSRYFIGKIDEVRIWNTGLSASIINSWFNKTITSCHPNYANLVRYYECNITAPATTLTATVGANGTVAVATYAASANASFLGTVGYVGSTSTQSNISNVVPGTINNEVLRIEVENYAGMNATQFILRTNGTTNVADISNAKLWYTGLSSTFATTTQFGSTIATPPAAGTDMTFSATQALSCGKNYFWLTYDVVAGATLNNVIDANYQSVIVNSISRTPTVSSPAGSRPIVLVVSPGGVLTGLETWIRADLGVTGTTPITAWANQNLTGTGVLVNGAPNLNNTATTYNYNPYVDFTAPAGTLSNGIAANRQCLRLNGYSDIAGLDYRSIFFTFQLNDLTRSYTHCATVQGVTGSSPANGTWHGDINGATASILLEAYDIVDFGTGAAANTWQRNGVNILSNSNHSSTKHMLSAVSQTGGSTTLNAFLGGQNDDFGSSFTGHLRDWRGPAAEIIGYTTAVSATDRQKIHSYLAVKYGTTMTQDYLNTSAATIFTTAAPYNNNIIGIGRDDIEALTQKQSHNDDDIVRIYLSSITTTNALNTGTFTNNISYVVTGANTGAMCATAASNVEVPAACGLYSRIEREWKVTKTNITQNFNMDFRLAACAAPGSVAVADLRLLIDDDGNFGNGGTTCYSNVTNPGLFTYTSPTITVTGITAAMIPNNSTRFITIGSVQVLTPLPIELITFDAILNQKRTVDLTWTTATEHNSDYFIAEKSIDLQNWENVCVVQTAGNSNTELDYACEDTNPFLGLNYYRLKQVDQDGSFEYSDTRVVNLESTQEVSIYPNPTNSIFSIQVKDIDSKQIKFFNALSQEVEMSLIASSKDLYQFDTSGLSDGIYYIQVTTGLDSRTYKLIVLKNK